MSFNPPRRVEKTTDSTSTNPRDEDSGAGVEVFGSDTLNVFDHFDSSSDSELKMKTERYADSFFFEVRFSVQTFAVAAPTQRSIWY